ncbi:histidinol-phosphate aminotransferase [Clostridium cavendishii DSM 21758]|uniref:Histidinol-phosphate aminotransferase n=1 Tax=Clostridium cavendishii DSM 21758 TaxID=1121302 RepID=A0A1M6F1N6_9CLOT|nr:histidinol-phosphate transaminase [Clostridium cavendishii]SHI91575.1 histidinol-phosphate aminotransferase [Clostridium cavendishii DSM 21758]
MYDVVNNYFEVDNKEHVKLNANENPYKIYELTKSLEDYELNRYPDNDALLLRETYGKCIGIKKENILAGNGSDEMINLIISSYISKGDTVITLEPDFSMYDFYTRRQGGNITKYKFFSGGNKFNIDEFISFAKSNNPRLIIFSNPNNPTGNVIDEVDIFKMLIEFEDIKVVIDEAYVEFYGKSMVSNIEKYPNLIIIRTLSKAWSMAALRVGFLIANNATIEEIKGNKVPYNINSISQSLATELLKYEETFKKNLDLIFRERKKVYKELVLLQEKYKIFKVYPSKANFIYGQFNGKYILNFLKELEFNNIKIRSFKDNYFRITIGSFNENKILIEVIKNFLGNIVKKKIVGEY